jgi:hypothetical protein
MRRLSLLLLAACLLVPVRPLPAEEPKDFLDACVKKSVGDQDVVRKAAVHVQLRGTVDAGGGQFPFTADVYNRPDGATKVVVDINFDGVKVGFDAVSGGKADWHDVRGDLGDIAPNIFIPAARFAQRMAATALLPLGRVGKPDALLVELTVDDRAALGLRVTSPNQGTLSLYFDKERRNLIKAVDQKAVDHGVAGLPNVIVAAEWSFKDWREVDVAKDDERLLKRVGLKPDDPRLLEFFAKNVLDEAGKRRTGELIQRLGDAAFEQRERASKNLVDAGPAVLPLLEAAKNDPDLEIARRAALCIQTIQAQSAPEVRVAAVRTFARREADKAVERLLALLPGAPDELAADVRDTLAGLAARGGKPDAALVEALDDKDPVRRAVARAVLGKDGGAYPVRAGRRLMVRDLKYPHKISLRRGCTAEVEVVAVEFLSQLDDKLYAKP